MFFGKNLYLVFVFIKKIKEIVTSQREKIFYFGKLCVILLLEEKNEIN